MYAARGTSEKGEPAISVCMRDLLVFGVRMRSLMNSETVQDARII